MKRFDEIRTARLLMRRWRESDRAPFADLNADPEVMRHFPAPLDRAGSDRASDRCERGFEEHGYGLWALEVRATGEFIGFTGLNPMPDGVPGAGDQEVGWRLARHAWHQGYATEAARAALDVGLVGLGLPVIWSTTPESPSGIPSGRMSPTASGGPPLSVRPAQGRPSSAGRSRWCSTTSEVTARVRHT